MRTKALQYYRSRGLESLLYVTRATAPGTTLPSLYDPALIVSPTVDPFTDDLLVYDDTLDTTFAVNQRLIRAHIKKGARIFAGEILYVKHVEETDSLEMKYLVGRCRYFAYASLCLSLHRELLSRRTRKRLHEHHLSSLDALRGSGARPQAVGCICVTTFMTENGPYISIANRSSQVIMSHDTRAAVPMFGMESNHIGDRASRLGLLYYNFLREFAEELFDLEDLVQLLKSRRVDPDWILQLPPVAAVHEEALAGRLGFRCLGVCVEPSDGALAICLLARFESQQFFERLRSEVQANWESVDRSEGRAPIEFVRLNDNVIDEWTANGQIDHGSALAIDLARVHMSGCE